MQPTRILVAEDNELVALTLQAQLTSLGYHVVGVAADGAIAVAMVRELQPDVVLMDVRLPGIDGPEAAGQINDDTPRPVIFLTAYSDQETVHRIERCGAWGFLLKPVQATELAPAIGIALARFHEVQQLRRRVHELGETLEARKAIERAKGLLMQRLSLSEHDAYEYIHTRARDRRVRMKVIADEVLAGEHATTA